MPFESVMVRAACGHEVTFRPRPDHPDEARRLAEKTDRPCGECRARAAAVGEEARRLERDKVGRMLGKTKKVKDPRVMSAREVRELLTERDRLRAALEKIAGYRDMAIGYASRGEVTTLAVDLCGFANRALTPQD
jgi:hypothetical protein